MLKRDEGSSGDRLVNDVLALQAQGPHRESWVCWHELVISVLGEGVETGFLGLLGQPV